MSDPFRVLRPAPMDGKGVYNRSSQVQAAASGLFLPLTRRLPRVLPKSSGGTATAGVPTSIGNEMRVPLTSAANEQIVTIRVSKANDSSGSDDVDFGFLVADANSSRMVDRPDLIAVTSQRGQPVTAANFLDDIARDGAIGGLDRR